MYCNVEDNAHIPLSFFFPSIVYRGLDLAVLILRDVSVSLSAQFFDCHLHLRDSIKP